MIVSAVFVILEQLLLEVVYSTRPVPLEGSISTFVELDNISRPAPKERASFLPITFTSTIVSGID
jgi:hypothetical protein